MSDKRYVAFVPGGSEITRGTRDEVMCDLFARDVAAVSRARGGDAYDGMEVTLRDGTQVRILESAESEAMR